MYVMHTTDGDVMQLKRGRSVKHKKQVTIVFDIMCFHVLSK